MNSDLYMPVTSQSHLNAQEMSTQLRSLPYSASAPSFSYYVPSFTGPAMAPATPDSLGHDESSITHDISRPASAIDLSTGYILQHHVHSTPHSQATSPLMHPTLSQHSLSQHASPLIQNQQPLPQHPYLEQYPDTHAYNVLSSSSTNLSTSSSSPSACTSSSATQSSNPEYITALENDPYFIPVQGVLPPSKNGEGRYECQLCVRSYTHAKHLKRHMMRHTGQKPYGCSWCPARFTRPDIRKRHVSKCKVRRKMEGLDSIKIEEENPAKMISLKNKKQNENKQRKAAAAAAAAAKKLEENSDASKTNPTTVCGPPSSTETSSKKNAKTPSLRGKSLSPKGMPAPQLLAVSSMPVSSQETHQYLSAVNSALSTPIQDSLLLPANDITPPPANPEFDSSALEASIKKELESDAEAFYSTPALSSSDLPLPQQPAHQTVYFSAMPTPSITSTVPPTSSGYMTPADCSPIVFQRQVKCYYMAVPPGSQQIVQSSPMLPAAGNYGIGIFYDQQGNVQQQVQPQPQMLTPQQHYGMALPLPGAVSGASRSLADSTCIYGESPLETFVPPSY